ncbi:MAG: DNA polymerase III subunit gamma/tau [Burkholderiaceae bacterium]|nr:DNA polymerase III subunit gamma/tau [Burkholderiaceae bacterium]
MTHLALARKWRPRDFDSLVGQEHVVRALSHALDTGRLHHAYLFTGTRGVGKTTIARILAKALNCERGVQSRPCGVCEACTGIDAGRFVDCIELDAASNRGVDEMTQLLENAVYAPTAGRYKVYVIDEVHMLSPHAFNAMLKTLEEPPPHVVFVLATTDPQRVPVTVLSRCLQFNLKNMPAPAIAGHLATILEAERVEHDAGALDRIGRAAAGSMRDALSLLDQAIAFGAGSVRETEVREMLGVVDAGWLVRILDAMVAGEGRTLVDIADSMLTANAPFERALSDFAQLLQRIALAQVGALGDADDPETLQRFARSIAAEDLQVYYQIVTHGARELALAPDAHTGFTMVLLRLLAFRPSSAPASSRPTDAAPAASRAAANAGAAALSSAAPAARAASPVAAARAASPSVARAASQSVERSASAPAARITSTPAEASSVAASSAAPPDAPSFDGDWPRLAARLDVSGFVRQFMEQSELLAADGLRLRVRVPIRPLAEPGTVRRVREALATHFGADVRLDVEVGRVQGKTAAGVSAQQRADRQAQAQAAIESDPFVRTLIDEFDGAIVPGSVRPRERRQTPGESE